MSPRKSPDRIEKLARELEDREKGSVVSIATLGRDLSEIKLNLAYQDEEQRELRAILLGDGKDIAGVVPEVKELKRSQVKFDRFVWLILTLTLGLATQTWFSSHEKPHPQPRDERPTIQPSSSAMEQPTP